MAIDYKDYYQILGVSRDADEHAIRKAFRKLARQHHPDVAKSKADAEEKFKAINEAYEVLGDAEKRKAYDNLGADWNAGAKIRSSPGPRSFRKRRAPRKNQNFEPGDFHYGGAGFSEFFEELFGNAGGRAGFSNHEESFSTDSPPAGRDMEADLVVTLEEALRGSMRLITARRRAPCEACQGSGQDGNRVCPSCQGEGQITHHSDYQVRIPPGVKEGQRLRLPGRGEASYAGGRPGDLLLRVRFAKHPDFHVEAADLIHEAELAPWEAVLGSNLMVPTLEGRVKIKIPPGTQNGQKFRVRNQGLPKGENSRGDLLVVARIEVPTEINERERVLWEKIARESQLGVREEADGR